MFAKFRSFLFENRTPRQTVAKNSFWLVVSNFGGRLIKAILIIYAARVLGAASYGLFSYALTLAAFLTLFMDPGVNAVLMRDTAKSTPEERLKLFSTTLTLKIGLLAAGVLVIIFIGPLVSTLPGAAALLPIVAFIMMFDTLREFFSSLIRGLEKMEWETAVFLFTNLAIVAFGFAFMQFRPTPKALGWGYALGTAFGAFAGVFAVRDYLKKAWVSFSGALAGPIIRSAWPFAITGALAMLLTNTDILIVSWMKTASDVGIYSAVIRIIQVLYLIPSVLQFSALPIFARLARREDEKFRLAFERVLGVIFLVSIPVAIGGAILGTGIVTLVFGPSYAPGSLSFKILMLTMLVDYPAGLISTAIFAYDHQKSLINTSLIGGISNVVFDLILIPPFGIAGSAVATLIAQTLSNAYLWHVMRKLNYFSIFPRLRKIIISAALMGGLAAALLFAGVPVALNILIGIAAYFGFLALSREPLLKEMSLALPIGPGRTADPLSRQTTIF